MLREVKNGSKETNSHWSWKSGLPKIAIDFHHTITTHCEACPDFDGYKLQEGVKDSLEELKKNFRIVIYSGKPEGNEWIPNPEEYKEKIIAFLNSQGIPFDEILFTKPPSIFIIDDRAIHHESWKKTMLEIERRMKEETTI